MLESINNYYNHIQKYYLTVMEKVYDPFLIFGGR